MTLKGHNMYNILLLSLIVVAVECTNSTPWQSILEELKASAVSPRNSQLNFTELTAKYGYISEEYKIETEDGYILTMFRISTAKKCVQENRSPPVLLMHGLLQNSDSWIDSGPNSGLAYLISDECYDLWVGNVRGTYYSREHNLLNPDEDSEYWNFYIDEIGRYDLPAMIDYVLDFTNNDKLNYIGYSQGAGTLMVMCSERTDYCEKVQLFIALAPATRHINTKSVLFRALTGVFEMIEDMLSKFGVYEVLTKGTFTQKITELFCQLSDETVSMCQSFFDVFDNSKSIHSGSIANATIKVLFGHFPAGTSVHNLARYGQALKSSKFEKFNYGNETNLLVYGSEAPPEYNLTAVTAPVVCIYGNNDGLVDTEDVEWLMSKLPNVIESVKVEDPLWNHVDVTYSQYTADSIFPKINETLFKYTST